MPILKIDVRRKRLRGGRRGLTAESLVVRVPGLGERVLTRDPSRPLVLRGLVFAERFARTLSFPRRGRATFPLAPSGLSGRLRAVYAPGKALALSGIEREGRL